MKTWIHQALLPLCRLVVVVQWCRPGMFFWHTLGPLMPFGHYLNVTAYLRIVSDHGGHKGMDIYPSSDGYFKQDNAPCHKV